MNKIAILFIKVDLQGGVGEEVGDQGKKSFVRCFLNFCYLLIFLFSVDRFSQKE